MVPAPHRFEPYAVTPSISASSSSERSDSEDSDHLGKSLWYVRL